MNTLLPIFLKIEHQPILVVGGGTVAEQKIKSLLEAKAEITVIAPEISSSIVKLADEKKIHLRRHKYKDGAVEGFLLVIGATDDREVQRKIFRDAQARGIPVNVVDVPELCTFYLSSVFQNGDLKIAVSTNGKSPTLGKIVRDKIKDEFSEGYRELLERLGEIRPDVRNAFPDFESRKKLHGQIVKSELERMERKQETESLSQRSKVENQKSKDTLGKVFLVGAGPGDPALITVKGLKALHHAEVVLYDALISKELLDEAPKLSEKIFVGKRGGKHCVRQDEINELLIRKASEGKRVVRLKGGDPFVFGRGGEEVEALQEAGIDVEVVPGITAGTGVPTSLGIPLTHRKVSSSVVFVTGHEDPSKSGERIDWKSLSRADTIVIYMGSKKLESIVGVLTRNGVPFSKPVAVIFGGTLPEEKVVVGTMQNISSVVKDIPENLPGLIIVGDVVRSFDRYGNRGSNQSLVSATAETVGEEII